MNAEMLKQPIVIQKATVTTDSAGVQTQAWQTFYACRAYVNGLSGSEYWVAQAQQAENTVNFEIRYCQTAKDINPKQYRILFNGDIYDIQYIDNFQSKNESLKIRATAHV